MAISRVGKELYDMLIKPYTKKQWDKYPDVRASMIILVVMIMIMVMEVMIMMMMIIMEIAKIVIIWLVVMVV